MSDTEELGARARRVALDLARFPSVTDSEGEGAFGPFLRDYLAALPALRAAGTEILLERTLDDPRDRSVVYAFVRGQGSETIVLTGHYDVVSTAVYGPLEGLAFEPEALAPRLAADLRAARGSRPLGASEARALADLESGDFLPGRGLLDMKAGLAAGIAVAEAFAARPERRGNLLFLAVPDEEGASHGMRSAVRRLPSLLAERGLRAKAALNLDAAVDQGDGAAARAAFLGSVGKLQPFAYFLGRPSHAGAPFDGVNPALMASCFARRVESDPDSFAGLGGEAPAPAGGVGSAGAAAAERDPAEPPAREIPPPPTVLYFRELRPAYDVTMPEAVFVSLNVLLHEGGPAAALARTAELARAAAEEALALLRERAARASRLGGGSFAPPDRPLRVLGWAELAAEAAAAAPEAWAAAREAARAAAEPGAAGSDGPPEACARLAEAAARLAGLEGPAVVVGLAPPYYPRAALPGPEAPAALREAGAALRAALAELAAAPAAPPGEGAAPSLALRPYFPGISDMSYLSPADAPEARALADAACPLGLDPLPAGFSCPVANLGPWGREYHQRLERVHAGYAFETLPRLLERLVARLLG